MRLGWNWLGLVGLALKQSSNCAPSIICGLWCELMVKIPICINDSSVSRADVFCPRCLNEPAGSTQAIMVTSFLG